MDKTIYKWNNEDYELNIGYYRHINIDKCKDERVKRIIIDNSIAIKEEDVKNKLNAYIKYRCYGVEDMNIPVYSKEYEQQFRNMFEYLEETDYEYYKYISLLEDFTEDGITINLIDGTREFYKFMYDNCELFDEIEEERK